MQFKKYNKIVALHKPECHGILDGEVHIQEKIDGANTSIWLHEDGTVHCGSRNNDLTINQNPFNGFVDYVKNHAGIQEAVTLNSGIRLYGEWLVRHTISYDELSYKHFYLFDVELEDGTFMDIGELQGFADAYQIKTAHYYGKFTGLTYDSIKEMSGKSVLGKCGEGVVVKPVSFKNEFGDEPYGKYVTEDFREDSAITFGGNNRHSDVYLEMYYVNRFVTLARVQKVVQKIEATLENGEVLDYKHIPRIMETVYYDVMIEEGYTIAKEMGKNGKLFNFKSFSRLLSKKAKSVFIEILHNDISVANL